ncbi:MAG: D-glycero-beta-D-manno-heptose-7-phosphate kinase, partial [Desulfobacterales bacterium]|nr:D-glycero-beta-D-manno-heptose-7-phosphate kinase [Desulfobacterales bacterium]
MKTIGHPYKANRLKEYIDRFSEAKVLVIGDIIMDEYVWGDVSRISPEAPVPVVEVKRETKMLGGAANVIHNIATLGAKPTLCGVVGQDHAGKAIINEINNMGLTSDGIVLEQGRPTSIKTRVVARNQQVVRFDRETRTDIRPESIENLLTFIGENLDGLDAIVVADYGKGVISATLMKGLRKLIQSAPGESVKIAVDPKTGNFEYYHGVDVITPNHHEAGIFCRFEIVDEETLVRAGKQMLKELTCRSVLITQGKDGMTLFENGGEIIHIPTVAKNVFDVTGAGDTVIGTFSLALASGLDLKSAAVLSNYAAGIVVGEVGTSTVSAEELKKLIAKRQP